ncbi:MAG: TonB-dependent receptor [bacterium]
MPRLKKTAFYKHTSSEPRSFRKARKQDLRKALLAGAAVFFAILYLFSTPALGQNNKEEKEKEPAQSNVQDGATAEEAGSSIELEAIVVEGEQHLSEREAENPTKFMKVIETGEAPSRVDTVAGVLDKTVGVKVNRYGGLGDFATVSIRGANPNQVQVYVDGVPVNSAMTGMTDMADLPLDSVEYIEVFRGFVPPDFGEAGIGGAVNLVTRKDMEESYSMSASAGSYGTYKATALAAGPAGDINLLAFASYMTSRGDFTYENDNGTPLNDADDFEEVRKNNGFESYDLAVRGAGDAGEWEVSSVMALHYKDQGMPGLQRRQAEETSLLTRRGTANVKLRNRSVLEGALDLSLAADGSYESRLWSDPEGDLGTGAPEEHDDRSASAGVRVKGIWRSPLEGLVITGYGGYREQRFQSVHTEPEDHEGKQQRRVILSGVFQAEYTEPSDKLTVQAGVRQEQYQNYLEGDPYFQGPGAAGDNTDTLNFTSPSGGIIWRLSDSLAVKANAGRFYRVPTFYELFGDRGVAVGNTDLKPEKGVNYDAGFVYQGEGIGPVSNVFFEYAYFHSHIEDLIVFFQNSQRTVMPANVGAAQIWGHELSFNCRTFVDFRVSGNYTFQSAVDQGDVPYWEGNALPMRPMHEAHARVDYIPTERFNTWAEFTYMSGNYWDRANLYEVQDRRILNLGMRVDYYLENETVLSFTGEARNMNDDRVSDVAGYPMPGRMGFITVQAKWR